MNFVQPIRDKETVQDIAEYLKFKNERNYIMWMMGIYSGLESPVAFLAPGRAYGKAKGPPAVGAAYYLKGRDCGYGGEGLPAKA